MMQGEGGYPEPCTAITVATTEKGYAIAFTAKGSTKLMAFFNVTLFCCCSSFALSS